MTITDEQTAQGSGAWLEFRQKRIGASDAPIILGVSPWKTPRQLWLDKKGLVKPSGGDKSSNFAIDRGNRFEPIARARYELHNDNIEMNPAVLVHKEFDFLMASLDGWNEQIKRVLEIKIPGAEVFNAAKQGIVHEKYTPQLEHQLLVSQGDHVHFFCCKVESRNGREQIVDDALVEYRSNPELREILIPKIHEFWGYMQRNEPPPITDRDTLEIHDLVALGLFESIGLLELQLSKLNTEYDRLETACKNDPGDQEKAEQLKESLREIETRESEQYDLKKRAARFLTHPRVRAGWVELRLNKRFKKPQWDVKIHANP